MDRAKLLAAIAKEFGYGCMMICKERARQIEIEQWDYERDYELYYGNEELALAATAYAMPPETREFVNDEWGNDMFLHFWPWDLEWWKPTPDDRQRELEKAGALIASQIDLPQHKPTKILNQQP